MSPSLGGSYDWTKSAIGSEFDNGESWGDDFREPQAPYAWEPLGDSGLRFMIGAVSLSDMATTDVIEYTHHTSRDSESIAEIWWNQNTDRLTVRFKNGGVYSYDEVGKGLYNAFSTAESMGRFFRETFRMSQWPGAKHDEHRAKYVVVPVEGVDDSGDLDSLKVTRLTSSAEGGNKKFVVHYAFTGTGQVEVRAADMDAAVEIVKEYFADKHVNVTVDGVFIEVK